ncbi:MTH1187 family thiamine-binding protein [Paenibacillus sp. P96]|uniref:MTH1187 family thiamine-binding protein n=1 Tax=Paenibacillus zeirhizosphaerae TaxID=2987519 RepID=A0ABT9FMM2_9BACL|nr:MTH1187 family thiamine-binding protein [Paenibacillus sp. P96]MDP4095988.1 MTH1187 family thiamine-binding protein [Paenibacillus sp. P96]
MAIAEVTVIPIGTDSTSLSSYVVEMQRVLHQQKGISYELTSMSTIIEGSLDDVFTAIAALHEAPFTSGAKRVSTSIKIDDRRDKESSSVLKLQSVAAKLKAADKGIKPS